MKSSGERAYRIHRTLALCLLSLVYVLFWFMPDFVSGQPGPVRFAFITDTHIGSQNAEEDLRRVVDDVNGTPDLDFALVTGDLTEMGSDAQLLEARKLLDALNIPWYVVPGNHDTKWSESGTNSFVRVFGMERFAFEKGGYLFVGTSSGPDMRMAPGLVPREHVVWLDSVLAAHRGKPIVSVNHYPLNDALANWYEVVTLLKNADTRLALCGHGHANRPMNFEGIPAMMGRSSLRASEPVGAYNVVTLAGDSVAFALRRPGAPGTVERHVLAIRRIDYASDTTRYPRPSFAINDRFQDVRPEWTTIDRSNIGSGLARSGSTVFYTNTAGEVVALDYRTGTRRWAYRTAGKMFSTPAVQGRLVIAGSTDGSVYALSVADGSVRWKRDLGRPVTASPVIRSGVVYIGVGDAAFVALDLRTGAERWRFDDLAGFVETRAAVDEHRVYFGDWGSTFYALDRRTGRLVWKWSGGRSGRLYSPAAVQPVVTDGRVFFVAPDRFLTVLDACTGAPIFRTNRVNGRESIGLSPDGKVVYIKSMQDSLFAVSTGRAPGIQWALNVTYGYEIGPTPVRAYRNQVYVPTHQGIVYAVDTSGRGIIWGHRLSGALVTDVLPVNRRNLLVVTMDGRVSRLRIPR